MSAYLLNNPAITINLNPHFGDMACQSLIVASDDVATVFGDLRNKTDQVEYNGELGHTVVTGALKATGNIIAYCNEVAPLDLGAEIAALKATDASLSSDVSALYTLISTDAAALAALVSVVTSTDLAIITSVSNLNSDVAALQEADASLTSDIAAVTSTVINNHSSLTSDIAFLTSLTSDLFLLNESFGNDVTALTSTDTAIIASVGSLSSDVSVLNLLNPTYLPDRIIDSETSAGAARYLLSAGVSGSSLLWVKPQRHSWAFTPTSPGVTFSVTNDTVPDLATGFPSTANITLQIDIGALTGNEWMLSCQNASILSSWFTEFADSGFCLYHLTYEITGAGASSGSFGGTNSTTNHLVLSAAPPLQSLTKANGVVYASALDNTSVITIRVFMKSTGSATNTIDSVPPAYFNGVITAA